MASLAVSRLVVALANAGIPILTLDADDGPGSLAVEYLPGVTQVQLDAANAIIAAFDWSAAADDAYLNLQRREGAKAQVEVPDSVGKVLRALVKVLIDEINVLRNQVVGVATAVYDPPNMNNGTGVTSPSVPVAGAAFGDTVEVAAPYSLAGVVATGYVESAGNVRVRLHNSTGGAVNLASGTWTVIVRRANNLPARTLEQAKNAIAAAIDAGEAD